MTSTDRDWLRKNWGRILLFLALWLLTGSGVEHLMSRIAGPTTEDDHGFSLLAGLGITALADYAYFKQKRERLVLENAVQIMRYWHSIMPRDSTDLRELGPDKDITLGLALEARGFDINESPIRWCSLREIIDGPYKGWSLLHRMKHLDYLIQKNLEGDIRYRFPKQVYFLRLNMLTDFRDAYIEKRTPIYSHSPSSRGLPILKFAKKILNEFYGEQDGYVPYPVDFDSELFRKCFSGAGEADRSTGSTSDDVVPWLSDRLNLERIPTYVTVHKKFLRENHPAYYRRLKAEGRLAQVCRQQAGEAWAFILDNREKLGQANAEKAARELFLKPPTISEG